VGNDGVCRRGPREKKISKPAIGLFTDNTRRSLRSADTNTQQLQRQNFCSRWTSLVELPSRPASHADITSELFRRQLKGHLFREARTRRSVTSDMWRFRKTLTYLLTYRRQSGCSPEFTSAFIKRPVLVVVGEVNAKSQQTELLGHRAVCVRAKMRCETATHLNVR